MPGRTIVVAIGLIVLLCSSCGRAGIAPGSASATSGPGAASQPRSASPTAVAQSSSLPCSQPAARGGSVFVYDSDRQNVVLFGGGGRTIYGDTWLWNGACWEPVSTPSAPSPRETAASAFDPLNHLLLVYGGRSASWLSDTWTWDGTSWSLSQAPQHPDLRFAMGAFDPRVGKVVVYGLTWDYSAAQTWTWDGTWSQITSSVVPPPRVSSGLAYDPATQRILLFGGRSPNLAFLNDTWAFDGAGWKQLDPSASPSARQNQSMASISQGVLLFGGDAKGTSLPDTWVWDGSNWQQLGPLNVPASKWGVAGLTSRNGAAFMLPAPFKSERGTSTMLEANTAAA